MNNTIDTPDGTDWIAPGDLLCGRSSSESVSYAYDGVICGISLEDIKEPTMQKIRSPDTLIDELAKGETTMEKILRKE